MHMLSRYERHRTSRLWLFSLLLFIIAPAMAAGMPAGQPASVPAAHQADIRYGEADESGRYVFLIEFLEAGLAEQFRQVRSGSERFSVHSAQMQQAMAELQDIQQQRIATLNQTLGRTLEISHHYLVTHSGIAARMTQAEAASLARLPEIRSIERDRLYSIETFRGPEFIGAGGLWDGSASPSGANLLGEDIVAAILDTGILPNHPSFANDTLNCSHGTGGVPDKLLSALDCATTDGSGLCNGPSPQDWHSHGSHVASTVAGNFLDETATPPPQVDISGVAPCAHVRSYRVCPEQCPFSDVQAGMNSVLLHGDVDVMNFSISGGRSPWGDNDRRKLDLVDNGIFVAASAGNTSAQVPTPYGNVNHLGPWVMSVANSSHDGVLGHAISIDGGPSSVGGLPGTGPALAADFTGPARWAGDVAGADVEGCTAFPVGAFAGEAALIARGNCNFSVKVDNAVAAGATFVVIYNHLPGAPIVMGGLEPTAVPSVMITLSDGQAIIDALDGGTETLTAQAALAAFAFPGGGDVLSTGSLIGPSPAPFHNIQKPDITAPGIDIYAAGTGASGYTPMSGTSMSSPHVAGAGALMRQARPDWSPVEVKSALTMTASGGGFKPDAVTPWDPDDVGSGRAGVDRAANAGFVLDETYANFLSANPSASGDPRTLNLPALRDLDCSPTCSFERTVRNTLTDPTSWSVSSTMTSGDFTVEVSPSAFAFTGNTTQTQTLTITITPQGDQGGAIHFGELVFTEAGDASPQLHWTLALSGSEVFPAAIEVAPETLHFEVAANGQTDTILTITNTGDELLEYTIADAAHNTVWLGDDQPLPQGGVAEPVELRVDNDFPPGTLIGVGVQQFVWFNRFTPTLLQVPFTLEQVQVAFLPTSNPAQGAQVGHIYDVYVWSAPDGDPLSATLLTSVTGQTVTAMNQLLTTTLPDGGVDITAASGDVLIGVVNRSVNTDPENYFPAATDDPGSSRQRSWMGFNFPGSVAQDPPLLATAGALAVIDDLLEGRNWLIRGQGTGGGACLAPTDVPWLTVTPAGGEIEGGDSEQVTVAIDMSGLPVGHYAADLCIESNDAERPIVVVPVTVEIIATGELEVDPGTVDFGTVIVGTDSSLSFTISNSADGSGGDMDITFIGNAGDAEFNLTGGDCSAGTTVLEPGQSCSVEVTFTPQAGQAYTGEVLVEAGGQSASVSLVGAGLEQDPAEMVVEPLALAFGEVAVGGLGMLEVTISNVADEGAADLELSNIVIAAGDAYSIGGGDCDQTVAPQASCTVEVHFVPDALGAHPGVLHIAAEGHSAVSVILSGVGIEPDPTIFEDRFEDGA